MLHEVINDWPEANLDDVASHSPDDGFVGSACVIDSANQVAKTFPRQDSRQPGNKPKDVV